ncbi:hypothetical protein [Microbacterium marmarense]|uniref:Galactose mutarotase n=1 Tax=Microbacterium marmarense TaxID=3122051 RepID=A0ABU8LTR4_9MICO
MTMQSSVVSVETWRGIAARRLSGAWGSVVVLPQRGAKIVSLTDAHGHEWLAQPDQDLPPVDLSVDFCDAELCGWDEIAPTMSSADEADHGDVWRTDWTTLRDDSEILELETRDVRDRFILQRELRVTTSGLELRYRARATTDALPFQWMAHPQFRAPQGTSLTLLPTPCVLVEHPESSTPTAVEWPQVAEPIDEVPPGTGRKLWARPGCAPRAAKITHPGAGSLTLSWNETVTDFAMWVDNRWRSREPVIAVEPTTSFGDDVLGAVAGGRALILTPDDWATWDMKLDLSTPDEPEGVVE